MPPSFRSAFSTINAKKGDPVELRCDANGEKPLTISWHKDRMQFDPEHEPRYTMTHADRDYGRTVDLKIRAVDRRDSTLFSCIASNSYGRAEYNIQLMVQGKKTSKFTLCTQGLILSFISISLLLLFLFSSLLLSRLSTLGFGLIDFLVEQNHQTNRRTLLLHKLIVEVQLLAGQEVI